MIWVITSIFILVYLLNDDILAMANSINLVIPRIFREKIYEMKKSREIDKQIAVKVMGFKVVETDDCNGLDNLWIDKFDEYGSQIELAHYSTRIESAWTVIEKVFSRYPGEQHAYVERGESCVGTGYRCQWQLEDDTIVGDWASTPAMAICLAALKAVENLNENT